MMRHTSLLWLLLAVVLPAAAGEVQPVAVESIELQKPTRIRLFGQNDQRIRLRTNATQAASDGDMVTMEGSGNTFGGTFRKFFGKNESESIGMPETFGTRAMGDGKRLIDKPYYREFALMPGRLIRVSADFQDNHRCVPASLAGKSREERRFAPSPAMTLTPEPGIDYEVSLWGGGKGCGMSARQVMPDGRSVPLPVELQRTRSPRTFKVEGAHLFTFLFRPGSVFYRVVGESADLQLQPDDADDAEAFEASVREIAAQPGTQVCVVLPDFDYRSSLRERLDRVLNERGDAIPAIFEKIEGVRSTLGIEDHVPTTFLAAASYCQRAAMVAFASGDL